MGKRNKEPQVGRRRPMIQLGGSSQKSGIGVVSRNVIKEEEKETKEPVVDEIDDQLAGFLAEINSLDDGQSSSKPTSNEVHENSASDKSTNAAYSIETFDPATQSHLLPENWQAIYDDSTSYYYYWNTVTNEVQWYPPIPPSVTDAPPPPPPPLEDESEGLEKEQSSNDKSELEERNGIHKQCSETKDSVGKSNSLTEENSLDNENVNETNNHKGNKCIQNDESITSSLCTSEKENGHENLLSEGNKNPSEVNEVKGINLDNGNEISTVQKSSVVAKEVIPSDNDVHTDKKDSENTIDPYSIIDPSSTKEPVTKKDILEDKKVETVSKEEIETKDKDKELMSKIKEKIQRKKEEKLRKEKEDNKKNKNDSPVASQKTKEEILREKLIKKKNEREKALTTTQEPGKSNEETANTQVNVTDKTDDSFSVDMFASEETYEKPVPTVSGSGTPKREKTPEKATLEKEEPKKVETEKDIPINVVDENSTKEKGGWRIIDAVYDDDDDEDEDEESDNAETMEPKVKEVVEKGKGEMDDYAEMLLEETIVEKETSRPKSKKKKSKRPFIPALPLEAPPPPPPEPENPPLPPEDEPPPQPPQAPKEEDGNIKEEITSTSSTLFEKLSALGISTSEIGKLQKCLLELEIRMQDWKAGVLQSKYFLDKLKELDNEISNHQSAPDGWISHWSSNFKLYYYYNAATGTSQWDHPTVVQPPPSQPIAPQPVISQSSVTDHKFQPPVTVPLGEQGLVSQGKVSNELDTAVFSAPPPPPPPETTTTHVSIPASSASLVSPAHGFSREPLPLPEKIVKTRKRTVPQESDKPPSDPYRDPYRSVKKKKEVQKSPDPANDDVLSGTDSGTASPLPASVITSGPIMRDTSLEDPTLQSYVNMTPPPPPPASNETLQGTSSPMRQDTSLQPVAKTKVKKKKKVEGLAPLKKLKHVSSLVQKWQTVKQQVEDEENVEEESDEDYETASERRINEWKKDMENSDDKKFNPNFTEIKGDWRARLKRKTAT